MIHLQERRFLARHAHDSLHLDRGGGFFRSQSGASCAQPEKAAKKNRRFHRHSVLSEFTLSRVFKHRVLTRVTIDKGRVNWKSGRAIYDPARKEHVLTLVPRSRLLLWVAVAVLPFSLLGAIEPSAAAVSLVVVIGLAALVLADAVGTGRRLAGITVELPAVARMSKEREAKLELRIRNLNQKPKTVRVGLAFPREIESPQEDALVALPAGTEWSRYSWPCLPRKRGNYRISSVHLEAPSPLGFWAVRAAVPGSGEIRVYPNLMTERRNLAALFLSRGTFGLHAQRQVGKGREFEKLREYIPGDGYDEVHWKATAKRGHPITKVFQIERTQEIYVIVDASRLSARSVEESPETGDRRQETGDRRAAAGSHASRLTEHGTRNTLSPSTPPPPLSSNASSPPL